MDFGLFFICKMNVLDLQSFYLKSDTDWLSRWRYVPVC